MTVINAASKIQRNRVTTLAATRALKLSAPNLLPFLDPDAPRNAQEQRKHPVDTRFLWLCFIISSFSSRVVRIGGTYGYVGGFISSVF